MYTYVYARNTMLVVKLFKTVGRSILFNTKVCLALPALHPATSAACWQLASRCTPLRHLDRYMVDTIVSHRIWNVRGSVRQGVEPTVFEVRFSCIFCPHQADCHLQLELCKLKLGALYSTVEEPAVCNCKIKQVKNDPLVPFLALEFVSVE